MNIKFKDYLCLIVPVILVTFLYSGIISTICVLLRLSEFTCAIVLIVSTIIISYPGVNLMIKYFKWYDRHTRKHKKK